MRPALFAVSLLLTSTTFADDVAWPAWHEASRATCEASFDARLEDVRKAIVSASDHNVEQARLAPWFDAHCRFLTELERTVRKLDEPNPFVCDTEAGRPKGLTPASILQFHDPVTVDVLVRDAELNSRCEPFDLAGGRISLKLEPAKDDSKNEKLRIVRTELEVMCWASERAACVNARAKGVIR